MRTFFGFALSALSFAFLQGCSTPPGDIRTLSKKDCTTGPCDVAIAVDAVMVSGREYCFATLPEELTFHDTGTHPGPKDITWTISPGTVHGKPVQFQDKDGILVVGGDKPNQLKPDKRTSLLTYTAKNRHDERGTATYIPVILFGSIDDNPQVCASSDPRIVND